MKYQRYLIWLVFLLAIMTMQACSKSSSSDGGTGTMAVSITDAPGDFDHVWITVNDIWFHASDASGPNEAGWLKFPLASPITVDLMTLANGNMKSIWDNITLPIGDYQQIRLVLADTDDSLTASAAAVGLIYNNEIDVNANEYPLRIPDARHGIRLVGHFNVTNGTTLRLAIDFDAGDDVVEFRQGAEFILKPRLAYFDLDNVGAIIGKLDTGGTFTTTPRFVIKAENLSGDGTYHVVRRWTVPESDGSFVLYPVSAATSTAYDVLVRGLNYHTMIIKGVPVNRGTTPLSGATNLGTLLVTAATTSDFLSSGSITSPTGAWMSFYQTLTGIGEVPYEIRFRHFHPITGDFAAYPLSNMPILLGTYGTTTISFTSVTPREGTGGFKAAADAFLYDRSGYSSVITAGSPTVTFGPLSVQSPWQGNTIAGSIVMSNPSKMLVLDKGVLFAVHGGMIVNAISIDSLMPTGGSYTMPNIPSGTAAKPLPLAFYGVEAVSWSTGTMPASMRHYKAVAIPAIADLRIGDDTSTNLDMLPLW
jgi:Domain of unknown function (DUF4382)